MARIRSVDVLPLAIPFRLSEPAAGFDGADWSRMYMLIVKVETDDGMIGWGEAFGFNCWRAVKAAFDDMVTPLVLGEDSEDIAALNRKIQMGIHIYGRYGITLYALSGLDIALWDLAGKHAGKPLHRLLGDGGRDRLPGYASLYRYANVESVQNACRRWIDTGVGHVKLHETELAVIASAHEVCASAKVPMMLDVNCCWNYDDAVANIASYRDLELLWLEEPVFPPEDFASLARLREHSGLSIAAGENACTEFQFAQMLAVKAVDYAQPSVIKVGGISEFLKVMALARKRGVKIAPHSPYFGAGLLATVHLCAAAPEQMLVEHFCLELEASPFGDYALMCDGGYVVPDAPGLGAEPDQTVIDSYLIQEG